MGISSGAGCARAGAPSTMDTMPLSSALHTCFAVRAAEVRTHVRGVDRRTGSSFVCLTPEEMEKRIVTN